MYDVCVPRRTAYSTTGVSIFGIPIQVPREGYQHNIMLCLYNAIDLIVESTGGILPPTDDADGNMDGGAVRISEPSEVSFCVKARSANQLARSTIQMVLDFARLAARLNMEDDCGIPNIYFACSSLVLDVFTELVRIPVLFATITPRSH